MLLITALLCSLASASPVAGEVTTDRITTDRRVQFGTGLVQITTASHDVLRVVATLINSEATGDRVVLIEAHTDASGSTAVDLELSQARAQEVARLLVQLGVDPARLRAVGLGAGRPKVPSTSREQWRNRRVEFVLLADGAPLPPGTTMPALAVATAGPASPQTITTPPTPPPSPTPTPTPTSPPTPAPLSLALLPDLAEPELAPLLPLDRPASDSAAASTELVVAPRRALVALLDDDELLAPRFVGPTGPRPVIGLLDDGAPSDLIDVSFGKPRSDARPRVLTLDDPELEARP